jgi:hypothetical protein
MICPRCYYPLHEKTGKCGNVECDYYDPSWTYKTEQPKGGFMTCKHIVVSEPQEQPPINTLKWKLDVDTTGSLLLKAKSANVDIWLTVLVIDTNGILFRCTGIPSLRLRLDNTDCIKIGHEDD